MADREKEIRLFRRAADQRWAAAEFLFTHRFFVDAVYLAGYVVECSLKASVLKHTPQRGFAAILAQLTEVGAKGHNIEYLKSLLKDRLRRGGRKDREAFGLLTEPFQRVASWSTSLRYYVGALKHDTAKLFMDAVQEIREWSRRS